MPGMPLSIGDRCHYRAYGSPPDLAGHQMHKPCCRPAIAVQHLGAGMWNLFVMNPSGTYHNECRYDELMTGGTWHLPGDACG